VIRAKQFFEYPLAATLGTLLAEQLEDRTVAESIDVVIPIPKYWIKRIIRGTNTAEVLAESIARIKNWPLLPAALTCCRRTRKQSLLGWSERQRNVSGSFRVPKGYDFTDARVLIVDDIMTTGATAQDAARALRTAGARRITLAVVARAIGERGS
jgi:predicted amidophosphoribosyltransferase